MASTTPQPPVQSGFRAPRTLRVDPQRNQLKLAGRATFGILFSLAALTGCLAGLTLVYSVDLPQINDLERYRPSTTTELLDQKGRPFGSFALERRIIVNYEDFSPTLRQAVISIEDKNFESHWGINTFRVAGALWHDVASHGRAQGASTLTMQLARNLFLSAERTTARKVQEAYLSIQIERSFTKEQIFTLYGNQIYLGHGMYGFEAASQFYFSRHASELTLPEAALLAGLPKGPVAYSPLLNPEKALRRRNLVLNEMEEDKAITREQADAARQAPIGLRIAQPEMSVAPWFVEEVRRELEKQFGTEQVHEAGLRVETTLDIDLQQVANRAVGDGLAAYERRHGWKGITQNVLNQGVELEDYHHPDWAMKSKPGDYVHALVTSVLPLEIRARVGNLSIVLTPEDWKWTGQAHGDDLVKPGDLVYVQLAESQSAKSQAAKTADAKPAALKEVVAKAPDAKLAAAKTSLAKAASPSFAMEGSARKATLEQDSGTQGSLMAMDNTSGDVIAMVGGRDYALSQFNRATQSQRQTGSSFKPYVYTAAIEAGVKPEDIVVDGPVSFGSYTPHNYEGDYMGAISVLTAFAHSRNIPALKLAARVGIRKVIETAHRFGVTANIPAYLPVALGAVEITLDEQVASYSVFPNDGVRVAPRLVRKVSNSDGITLWEQAPAVQEVTSQETARTMMRLLKQVICCGTGAQASQLKHPFGGKTGTTSDYTDAWFMGFSPSITCGTWVGFDSRQSLGEKETGAKAALPIWMDFMRAAIAGKDDEHFSGDPAPNPKAESLVASANPAVAKPAAAAGTEGASKPAGAAPKPLPGSTNPPKPANPNAAAPRQGIALPASPAPAAKSTGLPPGNRFAVPPTDRTPNQASAPTGTAAGSPAATSGSKPNATPGVPRKVAPGITDPAAGSSHPARFAAANPKSAGTTDTPASRPAAPAKPVPPNPAPRPPASQFPSGAGIGAAHAKPAPKPAAKPKPAPPAPTPQPQP